MKIKISDISITKHIRKEVAKIEELAENINQHGLLSPVTAMTGDKESYRLLAGLRRIRAAEFLGWIEINVSIVTPQDAEAALRIEISENEMREPFTFSEKMDFAKLLEVIETEKANIRKAEGQVLGGKTAGRGRPKGESMVDARPPCNINSESTGQKNRDAIGEKIGMSGRTYERARYIQDNAPDEMIDRLDNGETSIYKAYNELRGQTKAEDVPKEAPCVSEPDTKAQSIPSSAQTAAEPELNPSPSRIPRPLSEADMEAERRIKEFNTLPPNKKTEALEAKLRSERIRASNAEHELAKERDNHKDNMYHANLMADTLREQIAELNQALEEAYTRISELAQLQEQAI